MIGQNNINARDVTNTGAAGAALQERLQAAITSVFEGVFNGIPIVFHTETRMQQRAATDYMVSNDILYAMEDLHNLNSQVSSFFLLHVRFI